MDDINRHNNQPAEPEKDHHAPRRRSPWGTVEGRVISLVSRKGGVGKTTSAVNLGAALSLSGHTVLVVGTDPQCGVCRTLGSGPADLEVRLGDLFRGQDNLMDLAQTSPLEGLHFVSPGITSLEEEEFYTENLAAKVDDFVAAVDHARNFYDTILIDCPPSLGAAARAALLASDSYLVPVQAEELCRESLDSLVAFVDTFRERHFPTEAGFLDAENLDEDLDAGPQPLDLEGMFLTMVNERTRMGQHVAAKVDEQFGPFLFSSSIPRTTRLSEMALRGKPAVIYDRRSKGSRAYFDLADELVTRFRLKSQSDEATFEEDLPEKAHGLPRPQADSRQEQSADADTGGGLEGFLNALGAGRNVASSIPAFEEPQAPEMVSLDDLLAEEEQSQRQGSDDWDEGVWPNRHDRLN